MTDKELAKKAVELADKEAQERYVDKIKKVVQSYLEKIDDANDRRRSIDEELRILKSDLDDIKSGRLDKIRERQEKEPKAREISPIIIRVVERELLPLAPWRSPWIVEWRYEEFPSVNNFHSVTTATSGSSSSVTYTATGQTWSNFSPGSYVVGDKTINF